MLTNHIITTLTVRGYIGMPTKTDHDPTTKEERARVMYRSAGRTEQEDRELMVRLIHQVDELEAMLYTCCHEEVLELRKKVGVEVSDYFRG